MQIRCGYACINTTLGKGFRSFRKQTLVDKDYEKIDSVILDNFKHLNNIIDWNIYNNIYVFRVTSNLIPFLNNLEMIDYIESTDLFSRLKIDSICSNIRSKVLRFDLRLTIHLIEYTHINSHDESIMLNGYMELIQQYKILRLIGGSNIIFHGGGLYGNKPDNMLYQLENRLKQISNLVDFNVLTIENDDRTYTTDYVKDFAKSINIKWCFDFHHYRCNSCNHIQDIIMDYPPDKYHLSTGITSTYDRSHAEFISYNDFLDFVYLLSKCNIENADVMFESKGKESSILKIMRPVGNGYWLLK